MAGGLYGTGRSRTSMGKAAVTEDEVRLAVRLAKGELKPHHFAKSAVVTLVRIDAATAFEVDGQRDVNYKMEGNGFRAYVPVASDDSFDAPLLVGLCILALDHRDPCEDLDCASVFCIARREREKNG